MNESPALLPRLANAAVTGLRLLAVGVAALVVAIVATVTTIVGVAAKVLAEVLAQLAGLVREALPFLLGLVPVLARMLCLAFALGAMGYAGKQVFQAFGSDWLAMGLALLLAPTPFITLYAVSPSWPGALSAGLVALGASAAVHFAPPLLRMFILFVIFAWLLTRRMQKGKEDAEPSQDVVAEGRLE